jgi:hypothetical protein
MADYFTPTVVQPTIPEADMTVLERLLLTQIFESEPDGDGLYFFAALSPNDQLELSVEEVRAALAASDGIESQSAILVSERLQAVDADEADLALDLSMESWEFIFQDILRRSLTLDHITVLLAFTCSKMRPDGFGGMAVLITADIVQGKSTNDMLCDLLDEAEHGALGTSPGFGVHVLLRLGEENVREEVARLFETENIMTDIPEGAVSDADIRTGCLAIVGSTDLTEAQDSAVFGAAMAAIREARRRSPPSPR